VESEVEEVSGATGCEEVSELKAGAVVAPIVFRANRLHEGERKGGKGLNENRVCGSQNKNNKRKNSNKAQRDKDVLTC